jgi:hypothetical protein
MLNRILSQTGRAAKREVKDIRLFFAGDTLTDLRAGLYAGGFAPTTFLLATGSRLAPFILNRRARYGHENLSFLWSGRHQKLQPAGKKGVYRFVPHKMIRKLRGEVSNLVVIGDERYPGMTPPGSVAEFLGEFATAHAGP